MVFSGDDPVRLLDLGERGTCALLQAKGEKSVISGVDRRLICRRHSILLGGTSGPGGIPCLDRSGTVRSTN